jgi:hypothetical protein
MNRTIIMAAALAASGLTVPASAQMRVQGTRPVDPRLRNQPVIPPAQPQVQAQNAAPAAAQAELQQARGQTQGQPKGAGTPKAVPVATQGGPLKRPSYLGGGDAAPSAGPSSLDLMKQCFDGSISGTIANPACVGYIAGYVGAIRMSSGVQGFPICLPEGGLSNESLVADVSAYLEAKPDSLQKSARSVFFVVMSDRYPCAGSEQ